MSGFKELFEAYGADYDATMIRFLGSEALYLKILNMLPQDDNIQKLGGAIEAGDLTKAFEAAHTLKGVSGNLGLTPLYQSVCMILEPLRVKEDRDDYSSLFQVVETEFKRAEALLNGQGGGDEL